jgi:hypothetical protein
MFTVLIIPDFYLANMNTKMIKNIDEAIETAFTV